MIKRPPSVTFIGWLFIGTGIFGLAYHAAELRADGPLDDDLVWVLFLRLLAAVGGLFVIRGANWARWVLLSWIAYHVIISAEHSLSTLLIHSALLAVVAYILFRAPASAYFRGAMPPHEQC